jgi:hypothetical protein
MPDAHAAVICADEQRLSFGPLVEIITPSDGEGFEWPAGATVTATAYDREDGQIFDITVGASDVGFVGQLRAAGS